MRKYLKNGEEVEVLEIGLRSGKFTGFLVRKVIVVSDMDEEKFSDPFVTDAVYDKAPTQKLDNRILELDANIKDLTEKYKSLQEEVCKMESHAKDIKTKYQKYESLKYLDAYLEDKITHIVKTGYGSAQILDYNELKEKVIRDSKADRPQFGLRILSLFATTDTSEYKWRTHQYSDGSGSTYDCIICLSYDEAKSILKEVIDMQSSYHSSLIDEANKHDVKLDDKKLKDYWTHQLNNAKSGINKSEKDILIYEQKIKECSNKLSVLIN